jgi:mitotic spindle assembly checkpoint protein MAD2
MPCSLTLNAGTFTLLAYTSADEDVEVPSTWGDADPHLIDRGKVEQVRLRSFSTNVHSLEVGPPSYLRSSP